MTYRIPFNRPFRTGNELNYIQEVLTAERWAGDGQFTKRCEAFLEQSLGINKAFLTTSCTDALEMAAVLLGIGANDEIIVPSFTFVSTVNAFVLHGAKPVFADVRPDTLNLDERLLEHLISDRTKAIVVVHYAGVGCEMDIIMDIATRYGIPIVEDNAHGLFGKYRGKYLGAFGTFATQSFHETKNFTCGEGGALLVNEPHYIQRAEILREKGTNRSRFFRGEIDKYTWVDVGSSYLPSDLLAAFLQAQLEARENIQYRRREIWLRYNELLQDWAQENRARLPMIPPYCDQSYHMYFILLPDAHSRDALMAYLKQEGILGVFHYLPLHSSPMGQRFGGHKGQCPITEDISARLLRLPFYTGMTEEEQSKVVECLLSFSI